MKRALLCAISVLFVVLTLAVLDVAAHWYVYQDLSRPALHTRR